MLDTVQIPLWPILTDGAEEATLYIESSDSSMADINSG